MPHTQAHILFTLRLWTNPAHRHANNAPEVTHVPPVLVEFLEPLVDEAVASDETAIELVAVGTDPARPQLYLGFTSEIHASHPRVRTRIDGDARPVLQLLTSVIPDGDIERWVGNNLARAAELQTQIHQLETELERRINCHIFLQKAGLIDPTDDPDHTVRSTYRSHSSAPPPPSA